MTIRPFLHGAGFLFVSGVVAQVGCAAGDPDNGEGGGAGATTSSTTTSATQGSTKSASTAAQSSSTGAPATSCVPMIGATVGPECGKFVKEGAAGASGEIDAPFNSIRAAVETTDKRVYVCTGTFYDGLDVPLGTEIYGAIDCANGWLWRPSPTIEQRSHVVAQSGAPAIYLHGDTSAQSRVFGLRLESPDAVSPGNSSIAAVVEGGIARFDYVQFVAGAGAPGAAAQAYDAPAPDGDVGLPGIYQVSGGPLAGASGVVHAFCPTEESGDGGPGGVVGSNNGYPLSGGAASQSPGGGAGGFGEDFLIACADGEDGDAMPPGTPGEGGPAKGTFDGGRYFGGAGVVGGAGAPGGAGGGGGGRAAFACTQPSGFCPGPSGGSGGTGGCGGLGGRGGGAGGSSFGLVSLDAGVEVSFSAFAIAKGGDGADGGEGQMGGAGGLGGRGIGGALGVPKACDGGDGGVGGLGGPGGGGAGGHAIAIAWRGTLPVQTQVIFSLPTEIGVGGDGVNPGADGYIENASEF